MKEEKAISLESVGVLRRKKRAIWFFVCGSFLLLAGFTVLAFLFQNRPTQVYWILGGSVLTWAWLTSVAYAFLKMYAPLSHYLHFSLEALSKTRIVNDIKVTAVQKDVETYRGFKTLAIEGLEVDEGTRMLLRYEATGGLTFVEGGVYEIEAYDDVVVRAVRKP